MFVCMLQSKTMPKHPSLKEISDLGKVPAYVPPATALLPRMMEMMEHFKDQYSAMQRMVEVITEADRGKALALQRLLAQPLFTQKTPDGVVVEERVFELEKKVVSLLVICLVSSWFLCIRLLVDLKISMM